MRAWGAGQEVQTARWPQQSTQPVAIVAVVVFSSLAAASFSFSSSSSSSSWPGRHSSIHQSMRTSTVLGMSATNVAMVAQCQTENLMGIFESRALFFEEQRLI